MALKISMKMRRRVVGIRLSSTLVVVIACLESMMILLSWQPTTALLHYQHGFFGRRGGDGYYSYSANTLKKSDTKLFRENPSSFKGSDMTIAEYPKPVLRQPTNQQIEIFDDKLRQTAKEMMSVMYQSRGVGLAAPQVHLGKQLFVYNPTGDPKETNFERVVCNPVIKEYSAESDIEEEGCLSSLSDDCAGCVCRACAIMVEYQNELGQKTMRRLKGFEARVFQHEYDHIQGILHFDRFAKEDREKNQSVLDKLVAKYDKADAILDPDPERVQNMQPPPLVAGSMPPKKEISGATVGAKSKKKAMAKASKTGFGGGGGSGGSGGFGGGGGAKKPKGKKKKK